MYRFFKVEEFECPCCGQNEMQHEVIRLLDHARGIAGVPFIITSGYRCVKHNKDVGGIGQSAHLGGWAADIATTNSTQRFLINKGLVKAGFPRLIIHQNYIHADFDRSKPWNVLSVP